MRMLLMIVAAAGVALGQSTSIQVNASLRELVVTVRDDAGRLVSGLSASDFRVEEDGISQTIAHFSPDTETPISIGLLLDTRVSMALFGDTVKELGAARVLLRTAAKSGDEFSLMTFADSVRVQEPFTSDPSRIENALLSLYPKDSPKRRGAMSLTEAIRRALGEMKKAKYRRSALVILTESYAERNMDRFQQEIQAAEVPIFVLGFGGFNTGLIAIPQIQRAALDVENQAFTKVAARESVLARIADATGGRAELLIGDSNRAVERVITAAEELGAELRGQYLLGYYPKGVPDDGKAHVVRVQATYPRYAVRFRRLPLVRTIGK